MDVTSPLAKSALFNIVKQGFFKTKFFPVQITEKRKIFSWEY